MDSTRVSSRRTRFPVASERRPLSSYLRRHRRATNTHLDSNSNTSQFIFVCSFCLYFSRIMLRRVFWPLLFSLACCYSAAAGPFTRPMPVQASRVGTPTAAAAPSALLTPSAQVPSCAGGCLRGRNTCYMMCESRFGYSDAIAVCLRICNSAFAFCLARNCTKTRYALFETLNSLIITSIIVH